MARSLHNGHGAIEWPEVNPEPNNYSCFPVPQVHVPAHVDFLLWLRAYELGGAAINICLNHTANTAAQSQHCGRRTAQADTAICDKTPSDPHGVRLLLSMRAPTHATVERAGVATPPLGDASPRAPAWPNAAARTCTPSIVQIVAVGLASSMPPLCCFWSSSLKARMQMADANTAGIHGPGNARVRKRVGLACVESALSRVGALSQSAHATGALRPTSWRQSAPGVHASGARHECVPGRLHPKGACIQSVPGMGPDLFFPRASRTVLKACVHWSVWRADVTLGHRTDSCAATSVVRRRGALHICTSPISQLLCKRS